MTIDLLADWPFKAAVLTLPILYALWQSRQNIIRYLTNQPHAEEPNFRDADSHFTWSDEK